MITRARLKRAKFAFTIVTSSRSCIVRPATGLSWVGPEIPGFASPSRDGFALKRLVDGGRLSSSLRTLRIGPARTYDPLVPVRSGVRGRFRDAPGGAGRG